MRKPSKAPLVPNAGSLRTLFRNSSIWLFLCVPGLTQYPLAGQQTTTLNHRPDRIALQAKSASKELLSAPVITYGTYFGGSSDDTGNLVALDASGNVVVAGTSRSDLLPGTKGAFQQNRAPGLPGHANAYVAKFDPTGRNLLWTTFLGGDGSESVVGMALDKAGNVVVSGTTSSSNFPTTPNAYQKQPLANQVASYVTKIAADGRSLVFSTYLKQVIAGATAVNDAGEVYVTGQSLTSSTTIPGENQTRGSIGSTQVSQTASVFLIRLKADGTGLIYGANLGGGGFDGSIGTSIALDASGNCYVAGLQKGNTGQGNNIITSPGSYQPSYSNSGLTNSFGPGALDNGFVVKVNSSGTQVIFGTYFGPRFYGTSVTGLALDARGGVYFSGTTNATSLAATVGAFQVSPLPGYSGYVAHLREDGSGIDKLSYLPGYAPTLKRGADDSLHVVSNNNYLKLRGMDLSGISSFLAPFGLMDVAPSTGSVTWFVGVAVTNDSLYSGASAITPDAVQLKLSGAYDAVLMQAVEIKPAISLLVSSAGGPTGPVAPGQLISIFGSEIGPAIGANLQLDASGRVGSVLSETRVLFDGASAPLLYARADQVNAIIPFATAGHGSTEVIVEYKGVQSKSVTAPIVESAPGVFTVNGRGSGQGAILNQDGSLNGPLNAAVRGSVVVLYATGAGLISPAVDGSLTGSILPTLLLPAIVGISNVGAEVLYAGPAPGLVAGVIQVNVRIPEDAQLGDAVPVVLRIGNAYSQPVTLAIRNRL